MAPRNAMSGIVVGVDDSPAAKVAVGLGGARCGAAKRPADARARDFANIGYMVGYAAATGPGAMAERTRAPTA